MLQPTECARIRLYLGAPDQFRQVDTRLESILGNISDEAEMIVRECLTALATIENLILTSGVTNAGIKRVDEVWFFEAGAMLNQQRKAGRTYVSRISIILGVPIYSDCFGTTGYLGDSFSGFGERSGGGGFYNVG